MVRDGKPFKRFVLNKLRPGWESESPFREVEAARMKRLANAEVMRIREEVRAEAVLMAFRLMSLAVALNAILAYWLAPVVDAMTDMGWWSAFLILAGVPSLFVWTAVWPNR